MMVSDELSQLEIFGSIGEGGRVDRRMRTLDLKYIFPESSLHDTVVSICSTFLRNYVLFDQKN